MNTKQEVLLEDANNPYGVHSNLWRWNPRIDGPAFTSFLEYESLPPSAQEQLRAFTPRVLGQCSSPTTEGRSTGLVIGRVQSGKTNSFLALTALASDNGFRVIIILGGTKNILKSQTYKQVVGRLSKGQRTWKAVDFDPNVEPGNFEARLRSAMSQAMPRTLVITILKRTRTSTQSRPDPEGIDLLVNFIETSEYKSQLASQPVLLIDDEADEASLDTSAASRRQGRAATPSATHESIKRLRDCFANHAFVQYTATPQANLLVELQSQLSPDFCELLEPGEKYCGAATFFPPSKPYYREISATDIAAVANAATAPPETLVSAVHTFFIGAALEDVLTSAREHPAPRTMLVHPERSKASHALATRWVNNIYDGLLDAVEEACASPESGMASGVQALIDSVLQDLGRTVAVAEVRPTELLAQLRRRLVATEVRCVNSENQAPADLNWDEEACWIFVGGDVLQRGFAMQGLTVTWMARRAGGGQIDVLMQRGRWFGYRADFLPYCRIWMPEDVHDNYYAVFADHEEALWRSLRSHLAQGLDLAAWSRVFWMDPNPALRLCRRSTQWFRLRDHPEWASQLWIPSSNDQDGIARAGKNAQLVQALIEDKEWLKPWRPPAGQHNLSREHYYAIVPLAELKAFLSDYEFFGGNLPDLAIVRDAVDEAIGQNPNAAATLVNMRPRATTYNRSISDDGTKIAQLLAGPSRVDDPNHAQYYPGDRAFHAGGRGLPSLSPDLITLQVHRPALKGDQGADLTSASGYLAQGCPLLATYLPEDLRHYKREGVGDRR